jgi:hypothetical protein
MDERFTAITQFIEIRGRGPIYRARWDEQARALANIPVVRPKFPIGVIYRARLQKHYVHPPYPEKERQTHYALSHRRKVSH